MKGLQSSMEFTNLLNSIERQTLKRLAEIEHGDDFDWLMEMMCEECARNGIIVEDEWED